MVNLVTRSTRFLELLDSVFPAFASASSEVAVKDFGTLLDEDFLPDQHYILVDIFVHGCEPQSEYEKLTKQAKEKNATIFIIPLHGDSNFLLEGGISRVRREIHAFTKKVSGFNAFEPSLYAQH